MFSSFREEGRNKSIDLIKLIASLIVIFGHCMMHHISDASSTPLYNFIWLTQMPLFMFASGFVANKKQKFLTIKSYFLIELKHFFVLVIPCLTYLVLTSLIYKKNIGSSFVDFFYDPQTNLWFLWVLFVIHIFFDFGLFVSTKIENKASFLVPVIIVAFFTIVVFSSTIIQNNDFNYSILSIKLIAYYIPFFCLGYLFNLCVKTGLFEKKNWKIISYIGLGLCLLIVLFECFHFKSIFEFDDSNFIYLIIRVIGSLSCIFLIVGITDVIINITFFRKISRLGRFSLESYYLHILYLPIFTYSMNNQAGQWGLCFATFNLAVIFVTLTLVIIYFIPFLHLIIFGKSFSYYSIEKKIPLILR